MTDENVTATETEDTQGHRYEFSDRTVKEDVQPVVHDDDDDDATGHSFFSDRTVKEDVQPVVHDDED